jgi:hypothetical protein
MRRSSSHPEGGSALLEVLVLGSAAVIVTTTIVMSATSVVSAGEAAREAARTGAVWGARHGDADLALNTATRFAPEGAIVTSRRQGDRMTVIVRVPASLFEPFGKRGRDRQIGRVSVPVAPYRSNR